MRGAAHSDKQRRQKQAQSAAHNDGRSRTQEQLLHGAGPEKFPEAAAERVQSKHASAARQQRRTCSCRGCVTDLFLDCRTSKVVAVFVVRALGDGGSKIENEKSRE